MRCAQLIRVNTESVPLRAEFSRNPRVGILMSTYNGEKYLPEQIDSISAQEGVDVELFIRDDGSTDETRQIIEEMAQSTRGCIRAWHVMFGENIGFLRSFESLLFSASGCDFYSFSDQDDIWLPEKTINATSCIAEADKSPALYASKVEIVDKELKHIGTNDFPGFQYSIQSEFIRHRLAGHTMLWNDALQNAIHDFGQLSCWSHDQHAVIANYIAGGNLYLDSASYVLHRRLESSLTPGGAGASKRLCHEARFMLNDGRHMNRKQLADEILALPSVWLSKEERSFLKKCASERRLSLACDPSFDCGLAIGNAEARISLLLGRF